MPQKRNGQKKQTKIQGPIIPCTHSHIHSPGKNPSWGRCKETEANNNLFNNY